MVQSYIAGGGRWNIKGLRGAEIKETSSELGGRTRGRSVDYLEHAKI
jgi:hypothetical protein